MQWLMQKYILDDILKSKYKWTILGFLKCTWPALGSANLAKSPLSFNSRFFKRLVDEFKYAKNINKQKHTYEYNQHKKVGKREKRKINRQTNRKKNRENFHMFVRKYRCLIPVLYLWTWSLVICPEIPSLTSNWTWTLTAICLYFLSIGFRWEQLKSNFQYI